MMRLSLVLLGTLLAVPAPESPVADAAQRGDLEAVRSLVRQGADVNAAQGDGMTALHWAALHDDAGMIALLASAGANAEATTRLGGYTPLHLASREGAAKAVAALLAAGSNANAVTTTGAGPIHLAAEAGRVDVIRALLQHGADANARDRYSNRTPLMFAAAENRLEAMQVLLKAGADVKATTAVMDYAERAKKDDAERRQRDRVMAAARPPSDSTPRHASAGAAPGGGGATYGEPPARAQAPDPDSPTAPGDPRNRARGPRPLTYEDWVGKQGGMAALHFAARDGHLEAARLLLDAGEDINQATEGDHSTPLLVAAVNGNYDLAMFLLQHGAAPNIAGGDGVTPLFATINDQWSLRTWYPQPTAGQQQHTTYLALMEALLKKGADPNARLTAHLWYAAYNAGRMGVDYTGATAFWRAAYGLDVDAMRLLVKYGADPNIPTLKVAEGRPDAAYRRNRDSTQTGDSTRTEEKDPSGLAPIPVGGPGVYPIDAGTGVGYGTSRVGQQHRHVPGGWLPAVKYLVEELHADVNIADQDGYTPLHNAAARGDNETIEYLVAHGANVTALSRRGQTTVDMANGPQQRVQPFPETIALLEKLGAKNNHHCQSCE